MNPLVITGTAITQNYVSKARNYLSCLNRLKTPKFCICYDFPAGNLPLEFSSCVFTSVDALPGDVVCDGILQNGPWLRGIGKLHPRDILLLTDADGVIQRDLTDQEQKTILNLEDNDILVGWNHGVGDNLKMESNRLRYYWNGITDEELDSMYPGHQDVPCYNCGFMAMNQHTWTRYAEVYAEEWPRFNKLFLHRARCQWLSCWVFRKYGFNIIECSPVLHSHGHGVSQDGITRENGRVFWNNQLIFFAHML